MKKPCICVFVTLMLAIAGCGKQPSTPREVVERFLKAARASDYEQVICLFPSSLRGETEEFKRKDPTAFDAAAKEKGNDLASEYANASIVEVLADKPSCGKATVVVKNVAANVGLRGNILVMNQRFVLMQEGKRWVIEDIEMAPLTK